MSHPGYVAVNWKAKQEAVLNLLLDSLRFLVVTCSPGTSISFCCNQDTAASQHSGGKVRTTSQS